MCRADLAASDVGLEKEGASVLTSLCHCCETSFRYSRTPVMRDLPSGADSSAP
jgi:hypothetical protein